MSYATEGPVDPSKARINTEFTAVTDVALDVSKKSHWFVSKVLGEFFVETVPLDRFAAWVANLRLTLQ